LGLTGHNSCLQHTQNQLRLMVSASCKMQWSALLCQLQELWPSYHHHSLPGRSHFTWPPCNPQKWWSSAILETTGERSVSMFWSSSAYIRGLEWVPHPGKRGTTSQHVDFRHHHEWSRVAHLPESSRQIWHQGVADEAL
jgi:hypothetical protein